MTVLFVFAALLAALAFTAQAASHDVAEYAVAVFTQFASTPVARATRKPSWRRSRWNGEISAVSAKDEAALMIANAEDPVAKRSEVGRALDALLRGLE